MAGRLALRPIRQLDHAGRFDAARVDPEQAAAPELDQRGLVEHLDAEPPVGGEGRRHLGHPAGREVRGWRVGQVAGQLGGRRHRVATPGASGHAILPARGRDEAEIGERGRGRLLQRVVAVTREEHALDNRLPGRLRLDARHVRQRRRQLGAVGARARERRRGVAQFRSVEVGGVPDADEDEGRSAPPRDGQGLANLAVEAQRGQRGAVQGKLAGYGTVDPDRNAHAAVAGRQGFGDADGHLAGPLDRRDGVEGGNASLGNSHDRGPLVSITPTTHASRASRASRTRDPSGSLDH